MDKISVDVMRMQTSKGADYFVCIKCGPRSVTPHVFTKRFKAEYEVAHYRWIFGLSQEEPDVFDYDETSHPNT